ncbi:MAG: GDP-mannose 4,6-dehydratase [Chloroflexi bacterium]|nr:GDP-mannose 4,6-dehydratase [Chloroflexota bacterium]MBT7081629.1 GDP-mannose 4,6-dehydratase [Chloroflexota bacterium]MBT7288959.1 GDP-mannose 4,6-dehydratase [Chloroflexota bacterium]
MRVLITGITGFVGSHLAEYVLAKNAEVWGSIRWRSATNNIDHIKDELRLVECDMRDLSSVNHLIAEAKPDYIFHLAAQSFVPTSWHAPHETLTTNIIGQLNLQEAIRSTKIEPMMQIAGSSEEYGMVYPDETPIKETNPLRPLSPYGVSKVAQDLLAYQYVQSFGLKIVRTRAFNHTGPRRGDVFVVSDFARQIALIESGKKAPLMEVGNLDAIRDFSDVRDVVSAYWLSLEKGEPGEVYNICAGKGWTIKEMLDMLLAMSNKDIKVEQKADRYRPSDVPILLGDNTKFREKTGWEPKIPFEQTLADILSYWRARVA